MKSVQPGKINGTTDAPTSKSMMQRYVALATLSNDPVTIHAPSLCDDGLASLEVAKGLGAEVIKDENLIRIIPRRNALSNELNCGESGTSFRIFCALCGLYSQPLTITGEGSLKKRPMQMVIDTLKDLGVTCISNKEFLPLIITGPMKNTSITLDGSQTSQLLSGLLLSLPTLKTESKVLVKNLTSKPYVRMSLAAAKEFGLTIEADASLSEFYIPGNQTPSADEVTVEGDWSSASFLLVAGATSGSITLKNIDRNSLQADKAILMVLEQVGASVTWQNDKTVTVSISEDGPLKPFSFDATDCPDIFPPLVSLASAIEGTSTIIGADRLTHKESNRATALVSEYRKFGIEVIHRDNALIVKGGTTPKGEASIDSHGDHRIAMSAAVTALRAAGPTVIDDATVVNKSFPKFFSCLESLYE